MCGRFIPVPQNELTRIINAIRAKLEAESHPGAVPPADAYPKSDVCVVVARQNGFEAEVMRWGYPVDWRKDVVFNTRGETALALGRNMWTDSLRQRRCLVPSYGFYEPHKSEKAISPKTGREIKAQYRFNLPGSEVLFMAGIYEDVHFSIMTTAPNQWMAPVHNRMPVVLRPEEYGQWLTGDYEKLLNREDVELVAQPA